MQSIVFTAYFAARQVLSVALASGSHVIGRSPACQIIIPHDSVSRRHARLSVAGSDVVVTDLNSRNGTFLNGTRIRCAHVGFGQSLSFGAVHCTIVARRTEIGCDEEEETGSIHDAGSSEILNLLTQGQRRVLERLCEGEPEKQIAENLHISVHTVHAHVRAIYRQLGVHSRAELLARTLRRVT